MGWSPGMGAARKRRGVCLPISPTVLKSLMFRGPDCYSSHPMRTVFLSFLSALCSCFQSRACLQVENLALRHQINVLRRGGRRRLPLKSGDRLLWVWLSRLWTAWRSALVIVKPETVIAWHRRGFRLYWTWQSRHARPGRPDIPQEVRDLIRKMSVVPFGEHPESMESCSSLASTSRKPLWPSTWLGPGNRLHRHGVPS